MTLRRSIAPAALLTALLASACQPGNDAAIPGDPDSRIGYAGIAADEELRFTGTEPFWGGNVRGTALTYTTPEDQRGTPMAVRRFGGRGGLGLSGTLKGQPFDMTVTPGTCSDGMSDRGYPFVVMLRIGDDIRQGCGWTARQPFTDPG